MREDLGIYPAARRPAWTSYRAPCIPHRTGCRQCGAELTLWTRAYCSKACEQAFTWNHFWLSAAAHALHLAGKRWERGILHPPICARCAKPCGTFRGRREAEVNHRQPVNGNRPSFGCCHHQENLEVLCHDCHLTATAEQRRAGLIGPPRPPRPLLELA